MEANWQAAIDFVLEAEGSEYTDDPNDSGGPTKYGITWIDLKNYRKLHTLFPASVRDMTVNEAKEIYRFRYWNPSGCAALPTGLDLVHFDTAVNLGLSQAATCLKRTHRDGWTGKALAFAYLADRSAVYDKIVQAHPQDKAFIHGWDNRLAALKALVEKVTA